MIRLATGESTQRSELDAEHLTKRLREVAVEQLEQAPEDELWLIADRTDLRKPYAEVMPYLMQVRDLNEKLVPGYRTLNVIGLTPGRRGLLYHQLFSSHAPDFVSEPAEVQQALATVSQALTRLKERKRVTWLLDSGFDDVAVWRTSLRAAGACRLASVSYGSQGRLPRAAGEMARGRLLALDSTVRRARGVLWRQKHCEKGEVRQSIFIDASAKPLRN